MAARPQSFQTSPAAHGRNAPAPRSGSSSRSQLLHAWQVAASPPLERIILKSIRTSVIATLGLVTCLSVTPMTQAQSSDTPSLMPVPAHLQRTTGAFPLNGKLGVKLAGYTEPRLERARERFLQRLSLIHIS